MASNRDGSYAPKTLQLSYQLLRNTTSPDELLTGVKSFAANLPAGEILKLSTEPNLRSYIPEYNPRRRNRVHQAIRKTIEQDRERFITRNSGFVVTASEIDVDDKKKVVRLKNAGILNGAQSQGEIRQWFRETYGDDGEPDNEDTPFFVRAEIIVDSDPSQVVETAVARNVATAVGSIPVAAARGQLDDLEVSMWDALKIKITKKGDELDATDTRSVLQYARLLMPKTVSGSDSASEKLRAYKNPEQCLTDFTSWYAAKEKDESARLRYEFTVEIAPHAFREYEFWSAHDGWNSRNLHERTSRGRACTRDPVTKKITAMSPAFVFPILGAMSEFVERDKSRRWIVNKPSLFDPEEMISQAVDQFRGHDSDPMQMGRSAGSYDALRIYPRTIVRLMQQVSEQRVS